MRSPLAGNPLILPDGCASDTALLIERIAMLRSEPEGATPWKDIEFDLVLGPVVIRKYVWVLAAILRARDLTWPEIAAHPWVDGKLSEKMLRNKHRRTKLLTGQPFPEFVEWYVTRLREQFETIMAEQARQDSLHLRDMLVGILEDCQTTARKLRAGQQDLDFEGMAALTGDQLNEEALRVHIRDKNTSAIDRTYKLLRLTTASPTDIVASPEEAREATVPTPEELREMQKRNAALDREIGEYDGEVA